MKKIYFPGLNGVRFIAAFLVILDHTELFKSNFGYETLWSNSYSSFLGASGVTIFFVLSGFLITYLLISEKRDSTINIKNFYIRRILRIWPLYYLILIIGFFIAPHLDFLQVPQYTSDMGNYGNRLILFSGLLANVAFVYFPTVAYANILWSVAVEEQFYLFWPHIVKYSKKIINTILLLIAAYIALKLLTNIIFPHSKINALIHRTRFSSMMIGGVGAYLVYKQHYILKFLYSRMFQVLTISTFILLLSNVIRSKYFQLIQTEFFSIVVCCLIVNIATNKQSIVKLETKWLNYFGKISYGLYVYHLFAVVVTLKFLPNLLGFESLNGPIEYSVVIVTILALTTFISHISFNYFEKPLLRKKLKYTSIISGDLVQNKEQH